MTNLVSTAPGAFDAFLALLQAEGATQTPPVAVLDTEVVQYEPGSYVILWGFAPPGQEPDHAFEVAAIGNFSHYERYQLCGEATVVQGGTDAKAVRDATWSLYNDVVMSTVVAYRGQPAGTPVLGSNAPPELEWIIPTYARYSGGPGNFGGGQSGFMGCVQFGYRLQARITAA